MKILAVVKNCRPHFSELKKKALVSEEPKTVRNMKKHMVFCLLLLLAVRCGIWAAEIHYEDGKWPDICTEIIIADSIRSEKNASARPVMTFPIFEPVSGKELHQMKGMLDSMDLREEIVLTLREGTVRKKASWDICFHPYVKRKGRYFRLTSYEWGWQPAPTDYRLSRPAGRFAPASRTKGTPAERYTHTSKLSQGKWLKISVEQTGIQTITYADLKKHGINPEKAQIYGYGGALLPEDFTKPYMDDLPAVRLFRDDSHGRLLFYGVGPCNWQYDSAKNMYVRVLNHYSTKGYYFVGERPEGTLVAEMQQSAARPDRSSRTYTDFILHENDLVNLGKTGRECYGEDFANNATRTFSFDISDALSSDHSRILVDFAARGTTASSLDISINGNPFGSLNFPAISADNNYTYAYGRELLKDFIYPEANSTLKVTLSYRHAGGSVKAAHLNHIQLNVRRKLRMRESVLLFRDLASVAPGAVCRYYIEDADSETIVLDVTDPLEIKQMEGTLENGTFVFAAGSDTLRQYAAVRLGGALPKAGWEGEVPNQNLHGLEQQHFVILAPAVFATQAETLAEAHRQHDGLRTVVVTPEQVYNEFSSGTPDATAIRRFMKMFYDRAGTEADMPQSLLLFGDGVYDNRLVTGDFRHAKSRPNFIPTYESEESLEGTLSFVCDDYYGCLDDGEGIRLEQDKPDIGVGRFPVRTAEEADIATNKSVRYMKDTDKGPWKNTVCFLADDGDNNSHANHANTLADLLTEQHPEFIAHKIFIDAYDRVSGVSGNTAPGAHRRFSELLTSGLLLLNYSGHGSTTSWTAEGLLTIKDIREMKNTRLPLWVTATCDFCRYDDAETSGGEYVFLNANGGAAALVTTSRIVYSGPNFTLNKAFISHVFSRKNDRKLSLGEIMCLTKQSPELLGDRNKLNFALIGDPALKPGYPEYHAAVTAVNGHPVNPLQPDTAMSMSRMSIEGVILNTDGEKADDFNGCIYPTVFDASVQAKTLGNEGNDPFPYEERSNVLHHGKASVRQGTFSFSFTVPKDQSYSYRPGLVNLYACTEPEPSSESPSREAQGVFEHFVIGGTKEGSAEDHSGPDIRLYLNGTDFSEGGSVNPSPTLIALLSDSSGLNTGGSSIGHDIVLTIDADQQYSLNDYYESDLNSCTSGSVFFPLNTLAPGQHSLSLKAWDMQNNSSVKKLSFVVEEEQKPSIGNFRFGQTAEKAWFTFTHDRPQHWMTVTLNIFDLSGRLLWKHATDMYNRTNEGVSLEWNYSGEGGGKIGNGLYICRLTATAEDGLQATVSQKIIVSTQ